MENVGAKPLCRKPASISFGDLIGFVGCVYGFLGILGGLFSWKFTAKLPLIGNHPYLGALCIFMVTSPLAEYVNKRRLIGSITDSRSVFIGFFQLLISLNIFSFFFSKLDLIDFGHLKFIRWMLELFLAYVLGYMICRGWMRIRPHPMDIEGSTDRTKEIIAFGIVYTVGSMSLT